MAAGSTIGSATFGLVVGLSKFRSELAEAEGEAKEASDGVARSFKTGMDEAAANAARGVSEIKSDMRGLDRVVGDGGRSFGDYGTGLGGIGDRADELDTRMMGLSDGIQGVGDLMRGDLAPHEYAMALSDIGSSVYNFVIPSLQSMGSAFATTAAKAVTSAATHVKSAALTAVGWVKMGVQATINAARIAAAWLISLGPVGLVIAAVAAVIGILVALGVGFDDLKRWAGQAWEFILGAVKGAFGWVKENWPTLLAILTGPIGIAVLLITKHWATIKSGFTAVKDWIHDRIGDVVGFFVGLPGRLSRAAGDVFGFIADNFKGVVNSVIGLWNGLAFPSFTIGGWDPPGPGPTIPSMTVGGWSLPDIPYLEHGGNVARGGLALTGEAGPELLELPTSARVTPLDRIGSDTSYDRPVVIENRIYLDGRQVTEVVRDRLDDINRRNGRRRAALA